ncbi:SAM-dependent methyltransferase [Micromonospora sp. NPDC004551]|uniref:SAM-dependent methyltransferase n=1 Tax=Micromonospora sp. NPDC004551 TaxID=3154284 RepID=UPI0033A87449
MAEPDRPSTARMIDYWLGGVHHHPVDVAAAGAFEGAYGPCAAIFRALRDFLGRAVATIADAGVDGFLVFGAGVPTCGNVHEVAPDATGFVPGWGRRPVGVIFLGLAAFLDDDTLARTLDELYEAVAPGSFLAIDFDSEELAAYPEALAMMGPAFRMRAPARFGPLLGRWQPTPDGIVPVARWRPAGVPAPVPDAFYGALAVKPAG